MKCNICPLFNYSCGENGESESCSLFGDAWDSPFQYEDKHGTTVGCYIEKAYINKVVDRIDEYHKEMVARFLEEERQESLGVEDIFGE